MFLVVTDLPSGSWPVVVTNFSEWAQIFRKNPFRGRTNFRGVQIECDRSTTDVAVEDAAVSKTI